MITFKFFKERGLGDTVAVPMHDVGVAITATDGNLMSDVIMSHEDAQFLLDQMWHAGMRPGHMKPEPKFVDGPSPTVPIKDGVGKTRMVSRSPVIRPKPDRRR